MYFTTKSGTIYTVNTEDKKISNGKGKEFEYKRLDPVMVGSRARVYLNNGTTLVTSEVIKVHS